MAEDHRSSIEDFLFSIGVSRELVSTALFSGASSAPRRRVRVRSATSSEYVAFASWDAPNRLQDQLAMLIFVDDDHPDATAVATHLLDLIAQDLSYYGCKRLCLYSMDGHSRVRSAAHMAGFSPERSGQGCSVLRKVAIGGAISPGMWCGIRAKIAQLAGLNLPVEIPAFHGAETPITVTQPDGTRTQVKITELERAMHPALFVLPDRPAVILPIRRVFAEHLFSSAAQLPLLPRGGAALSSDRVYFKSPHSGCALEPGIPVVFYESAPHGGRAAAFACATVKSNRIIWAETVSQRFLQKGVLDRSVVERCAKDGLVSMLHFENVLMFPRPVGLSRLRLLGAVDGANLVTTRRLTSERLLAILTEGNALAL